MYDSEQHPTQYLKDSASHDPKSKGNSITLPCEVGLPSQEDGILMAKEERKVMKPLL